MEAHLTLSRIANAGLAGVPVEHLRELVRWCDAQGTDDARFLALAEVFRPIRDEYDAVGAIEHEIAATLDERLMRELPSILRTASENATARALQLAQTVRAVLRDSTL